MVAAWSLLHVHQIFIVHISLKSVEELSCVRGLEGGNALLISLRFPYKSRLSLKSCFEGVRFFSEITIFVSVRGTATPMQEAFICS